MNNKLTKAWSVGTPEQGTIVYITDDQAKGRFMLDATDLPSQYQPVLIILTTHYSLSTFHPGITLSTEGAPGWGRAGRARQSAGSGQSG